jgi:DNA ligase 1
VRAFTALSLALGSRSADQAVQQRQQQTLALYLQQAPRADAAWAVTLLAGGSSRPAATLDLMRDLACDMARIQPWLFEACRAASGDLAETIAHLAPVATRPQTLGLAHWMEQRIGLLRGLPAAEQACRIREDWQALAPDERVLYVRLVSGSFRSALTPNQVQQALAQAFRVPAHLIAQRLPAYLAEADTPTPARFEALVQAAQHLVDHRLNPLAWAPAAPLQTPPQTLGDRGDWQVEWALQGLRVQVVRRGGHSAVWSRTDDLLNGRLPDIVALAQRLPEGTVIDGQLVLWPQGASAPAPMDQLLARLRGKTPAASARREASVRLMAFDLLELQGQDLRARSLALRRAALTDLARESGFSLSEPLAATSWADLELQRNQARKHGATGLIVKRLSSAYDSGSADGDPPWWSWKSEPLRVRTVLLYAEGAGSRHAAPASFSFAVWSRAPVDAGEVQAVLQDIVQQRRPDPARLHLVPIAKLGVDACGGLLARLHDAAREHTVGNFGPVRSLLPTVVLDLGFEGVSRSARHKCGLTLQAPQLLGVHEGSVLTEVGTVLQLQALLGERPAASD